MRTWEEIRKDRPPLFGLDVAQVAAQLGKHSEEICRHFDRMEAQLNAIHKVLVAIEENTRPMVAEEQSRGR